MTKNNYKHEKEIVNRKLFLYIMTTFVSLDIGFEASEFVLRTQHASRTEKRDFLLSFCHVPV